MSEIYSPAGNVSAQNYHRATAGEAATGTHGDEFMRQDMTQIADRIRFLDDNGFPNVSKIMFPATQVPSAGANDLDDYEEGSWTPTDASGASLAFSSAFGLYEKIGRLVIARARVTYPATADSSAAQIGGFPFTVANSSGNDQAFVTWSAEVTLRYVQPILNAARGVLFTSAGATIANSIMSADTVYFTAVYNV